MRETLLRWIEEAVTGLGFIRRDRVFSRKSGEPGLIQVIALQMGKGACAGLFRINVGIFIPEAHRVRTGKPIPTNVDDFDCQIRIPLHILAGRSGWGFPMDEEPDLIHDSLQDHWAHFGLPFLKSLESRRAILAEDWTKYSPRAFVLDNISRAAVLVDLGEPREAERALQVEYTSRSQAPPGSRELVLKAAAQLGLALKAGV